MKKVLSVLVITMLMIACNNGEPKINETAAKTSDTVTAEKSVKDTVPSTLTTVVIADTPEAMATELCRLNKGIKLAKAMGDQPMADVTQKKYMEYNQKMKQRFGNDELAKITIKSIMENCGKK